MQGAVLYLYASSEIILFLPRLGLLESFALHMMEHSLNLIGS